MEGSRHPPRCAEIRFASIDRRAASIVAFGARRRGPRRSPAHACNQKILPSLTRFHLVGIDAEWSALHVLRHEGAKPLAGHDQPVGSERRHRLAHYRATDARGQREFLLGRQTSARLQAAAEDLGGKPLSQRLGPIERRRHAPSRQSPRSCPGTTERGPCRGLCRSRRKHKPGRRQRPRSVRWDPARRPSKSRRRSRESSSS